MELSKVYLLFEILREARGYPNLGNIAREAQKQLQTINDNVGAPAESPMDAVNKAQFVEEPKSIPSAQFEPEPTALENIVEQEPIERRL